MWHHLIVNPYAGTVERTPLPYPFGRELSTRSLCQSNPLASGGFSLANGLLAGSNLPLLNHISISAASSANKITTSSLGGKTSYALASLGVGSLIIKPPLITEKPVPTQHNRYILKISGNGATLLPASLLSKKHDPERVFSALRKQFGENSLLLIPGIGAMHGYFIAQLIISESHGMPLRFFGHGGPATVLGASGIAAIVILAGKKRHPFFLGKGKLVAECVKAIQNSWSSMPTEETKNSLPSPCFSQHSQCKNKCPIGKRYTASFRANKDTLPKNIKNNFFTKECNRLGIDIREAQRIFPLAVHAKLIGEHPEKSVADFFYHLEAGTVLGKKLGTGIKKIVQTHEEPYATKTKHADKKQPFKNNKTNFQRTLAILDSLGLCVTAAPLCSSPATAVPLLNLLTAFIPGTPWSYERLMAFGDSILLREKSCCNCKQK